MNIYIYVYMFIYIYTYMNMYTFKCIRRSTIITKIYTYYLYNDLHRENRKKLQYSQLNSTNRKLKDTSDERCLLMNTMQLLLMNT